MRKLIIANWKLNPLTEREAVRLARASDQPNVVIAAPFPFLLSVKATVRKANIAAQDVSAIDTPIGARTGEVSATMLRNIGVQYVIIGHSERRPSASQTRASGPHAHGVDTDEAVAAKLKAALTAGITPILCVGEPWSVRRRGFPAAKAYVQKQLTIDLKPITRYRLPITHLLVAYEPIWAISTSKDRRDPSMSFRAGKTPEDAARMAQFIQTQLKTLNFKLSASGGKTRVLYGGSVNAKNAASFLTRPEFAGVLVGGASLKPAEFRKIITAAKKA